MVRVRLANPPDSILAAFSKNERRFYCDYSEFVFRELSKDKVQSFLDSAIAQEEIDLSKVEDVRIMRFPFGASEGETDFANREGINIRTGQTFGLYIPTAKTINIYPPRISTGITEKTLARQFYDNEVMRYYFFCFEPVKTLVHEFLHVKYKKEEETVERLSEEYMIDFEKRTTGVVNFSRKESFFPRL